MSGGIRVGVNHHSAPRAWILQPQRFQVGHHLRAIGRQQSFVGHFPI
jgi:hypothetical protein